MDGKVSTKLPKADRRTQLLEVAHVIAREEGTDALTLGYLAERAGVSKPLVYSHFETRSGLLLALFDQINGRQVESLKAALKRTQPQLDDVARVMATAYMNCYAEVGPEWHAIAAALKGSAEMDSHQRAMIESHEKFYYEALAPLSSLRERDVRRRCVGIIGAAEALSEAMVRRRVTKREASEDLMTLIIAWLSPPQPR
jgi:AcrR family transcriptional regulator